MSKIDLRIRNNNKLYSIVLNDYRIGGCKWNDIEHGKCIEFPVNKEDVFVALGVDKTIANLQSQLDQANERLKGVGLAKFGLGQEVFVFDWDEQIRSGRIYEIQTNAVLHDRQPHITYLVDFTGNYSDDDQENDYYEEKDIYTTCEEAEKKLQELRNGVFFGGIIFENGDFS